MKRSRLPHANVPPRGQLVSPPPAIDKIPPKINLNKRPECCKPIHFPWEQTHMHSQPPMRICVCVCIQLVSWCRCTWVSTVKMDAHGYTQSLQWDWNFVATLKGAEPKPFLKIKETGFLKIFKNKWIKDVLVWKRKFGSVRQIQELKNRSRIKNIYIKKRKERKNSS